MSTEKPLILTRDNFVPTTKSHYGARRAVHRSISRGYNDLANGWVRPWTQTKAKADRMRAISPGPHVTTL